MQNKDIGNKLKTIMKIANQHIKQISILVLVVILIVCSCSKDKDFVTTEMGFAFKRCTTHDTTPKAKQGDIVYGNMKILLNNQTVVSNTYPNDTRLFVIGQAKIGSIDEFLQTLHVGDSAIMIVPCDSMVQYLNDSIETRPKDKLYIYLTISQIISQREINDQENEIYQKQQEEQEALTNYVLEHYSMAERKPSGIFFLLDHDAKKEKAQWGKRLHVAYTVMDTNKKVYDTSIEEVAKKSGIYNEQRVYKPFDFVLGDDGLIAGWSEGMSYMGVGDRATIIVPSKLAYGDVGFGQIKANTPLIFEVYLIKMTDD